ncbi:MAG: ketopantoate reductase family protein [Gammaproteobacteria bacterium]
MRIAVIGTGAMGSVYAGLLADAGNEVWAIDVWQEHLDAIRERGLRVEGASGDRVVRGIQVSTRAGDAGACDLVIIATKASGVGAAARSIVPLLHDDTLVLTIQNGLGAGERICEHLPADNVLLGVAGGFGASIKGPGHAHHNGMELIRVGELQGGHTDRVERVAQLWRDAGFNVKAFEDINQLVWEKFICNVSFSAPCTVFGRRIGEMMADPHAWKISLGCGLEAFEAGRAKGVNLSFDDPEAYITAFGARMPDARPSMLLDHLAKRPSEIDAINGMVPVVAANVGTQAPYNEVMTAIVRSREAEFSD